MGNANLSRVVKVAVISRVIIFFSQLIFNASLPDHDAGVFRKPKPIPKNQLEFVLTFVLEGLERWDGQYFLNIAEYGYVYEKSLAFFPLFPLLISSLANTVLYPLSFLCNYHLVLLTSAVLLNNALFVLTAVVVYKLSYEVLSNEQWALKSAVLFCFNPASIFFAAVYSESLFCFLVCTAMYQYQKSRFTWSAVFFSLATLSRSNGAVNAGFMVYVNVMVPIFGRMATTNGNKCDLKLVLPVLSGIFRALLVVVPFAGYQLYAYKVFCQWSPPKLPAETMHLASINRNEYVLPGDYTPWCHSAYPISYAYVQERYWEVGFFKYFHIKQIPNFVLATPTILLCIQGIFSYAIQVLKALHDEKIPQRTQEMLPYVLHCSFLLVFGITSMHVQVITRLLASSSPTLCWFAAELLPDFPQTKRKCCAVKQKKRSNVGLDCVSMWNRLKSKGKLVLFYFFLYYVVGTAAFANHLPWT